MLNNDYFYNETMKKIIAVFGSIFNDIYIAKRDGALKSVQKVPLAYAPHERYLTRLHMYNEDETTDVAIKLPRMAFEIASLNADTATKLNRHNRTVQTDPSTGNAYKVWQAAPYLLGITLKIMSRGQDEALQIVEQIFPFFNPTYTITVKGIEGPDSKTDLPITLNSTEFEDSFAGGYENSRRLIIYTLNFTLPIKFVLPVKSADGGIIKDVRTNFLQCGTGEFITSIDVRTQYEDDTVDDYNVVCSLDALPYEEGDDIWDERPSEDSP